MMSHLTFDEIQSYLDADKTDEETILLCSRVDTHVLRCKKCLQLVNAMETLQGEFTRLNASGEAEGVLAQRTYSKQTNKRLAELRMLFPKETELNA